MIGYMGIYKLFEIVFLKGSSPIWGAKKILFIGSLLNQIF